MKNKDNLDFSLRITEEDLPNYIGKTILTCNLDDIYGINMLLNDCEWYSDKITGQVTFKGKLIEASKDEIKPRGENRCLIYRPLWEKDDAIQCCY